MQCRQCGTEIADKALICYRCGTATTEAKYKAAPIRVKRKGRRLIVVVVLVALLVLLALFLLNSGLLTTDARPEAPDQLLSSAAVELSTTGWVIV